MSSVEDVVAGRLWIRWRLHAAEHAVRIFDRGRWGRRRASPDRRADG